MMTGVRRRRPLITSLSPPRVTRTSLTELPFRAFRRQWARRQEQHLLYASIRRGKLSETLLARGAVTSPHRPRVSRGLSEFVSTNPYPLDPPPWAGGTGEGEEVKVTRWPATARLANGEGTGHPRTSLPTPGTVRGYLAEIGMGGTTCLSPPRPLPARYRLLPWGALVPPARRASLVRSEEIPDKWPLSISPPLSHRQLHSAGKRSNIANITNIWHFVSTPPSKTPVWNNREEEERGVTFSKLLTLPRDNFLSIVSPNIP